MPFYDLRCTKCDKEFNIMATMADKAAGRIPCPECGTMGMVNVYKSAPYYNRGAVDTTPLCPNSQICGASCPHSKGA